MKKKEWSDFEINFIKNNITKKNTQEISDLLGKTLKEIKSKIKELGLKELDEEILIYKKKAELAGWVEQAKIEKIEIKPTIEKGEAVAFCLASDWHIGEVINPKTINGINSYNLRIAEERAKKFFENSIKLVNICKRDIRIDNIVFALMGDLMTGYIHEELLELNSISPVQEIIKLKSILISGIKYYLQNFKGNIIIPCVVGNHGDTRQAGQKPKTASQVINSYEWLLYNELYDYFKNIKRVKFNISDGYFAELIIYGKKIRIHHGHNIRYSGGVGGITIPVNKAIAQWNKIPPKPADLDLFGHFHQYAIHKDWICNGSLCGYNTYALKIKAEYEEPKQAFFLLDKKRGITINAPILVE